LNFRGGTFKEILFNVYADLTKDLESKKTELETYANDTVIQNAKDTMDDYITDTSKPDLDSYESEKETELNTYTTAKKSELDTYEGEKESELETYTTTKKSELNIYEIQLEGSLDDYLIIKKSELDSYALEKISEIEESTGVVFESSITDDYTGSSSSLVASQKALYDGLSTKSDTHTHPYRADTWTPTASEIGAYPSTGDTSLIINGVTITVEV
jgi:hypothetical protein